MTEVIAISGISLQGIVPKHRTFPGAGLRYGQKAKFANKLKASDTQLKKRYLEALFKLNKYSNGCSYRINRQTARENKNE